MAINVSEIGINRIRIGSANVTKVVVLKPINEMQAIVNPRNNAPQSPIKMDAGWKL
jgi:hypothetical protein